jgi:hypothetical protein
MDNRSGLIMFAVMVLLFGFSFLLGYDALVQANTLYGVLSLVGYIVCIFGSIMNGLFARKEGGALALYYFGLAVIVSIIFIWHLTRCGTYFGLW